MASFLVYVFILPSIEPMKNFDDERVGGGIDVYKAFVLTV